MAGQAGAGEAQYLVLRDEIVGGALPSGTTLLETALAARLGVGRAPVREAILRLECDGLVVRGSRGPQVRTLTATEVVEIYQARIALEAEAAASAAAHRSALDLARLRHVHEEARQATDPDQIRMLHGRWHSVLRQACHNPTITGILERLALQLALYDSVDMSRNPNLDSSDDEHTAVLDAITAGDQDTARSLLRTHLERTRDVRIAALVREETTAG
ncbi:GntR family transcriptional regulator [Pseudonocardia ailaonensis]|uniref:GntR family transcriptional regulator n=1 Tax=Pseudonocardia ailaonensis TaxID=367279 RepID=A0ABN2N257_9PSEU